MDFYKKLIMEAGKNKTSSTTTSTGLPQGSSLSPLLFNIYAADLHNVETKDCKIVQYADDFAVLVRAKSWNEVELKAYYIIKQSFSK